MTRMFEIGWERVLPATPAVVWDAVTRNASGWLWPVEYEPRVGGAERGLSSSGGTVAAWEPERRFVTRSGHAGDTNELRYALEPAPAGTLVRYTHAGAVATEAEYDQCVRHTEFYRHTLAEHVRYFDGRGATYVTVEAPGSFAELCRAIGLPDDAGAGARVVLDAAGPAVVDYRDDAFVGLRTADALIRGFGRDAWGGEAALALHLFDPAADADAAARAWTAVLGAVA